MMKDHNMTQIEKQIGQNIHLFRYVYLTIIVIILFNLVGCDENTQSIETSKSYSDVPKKKDKTEDTIGHFTINGMTFVVPRNYMPFDRNKKSGDVEAFTLRYYLPAFTNSPSENTSNENDSNGAVHVLIKKCTGDKCKDISLIDYQTNLKLRGGITNGCVHGDGKPVVGLSLKSYIVNAGTNTKNEREILINGDTCNPDFYLVCSTANSAKYPLCQRWFYYKNNILVNYAFNKTYLANYINIEKTLISKLNEYVGKKGTDLFF